MRVNESTWKIIRSGQTILMDDGISVQVEETFYDSLGRGCIMASYRDPEEGFTMIREVIYDPRNT